MMTRPSLLSFMRDAEADGLAMATCAAPPLSLPRSPARTRPRASSRHQPFGRPSVFSSGGFGIGVVSVEEREYDEPQPCPKCGQLRCNDVCKYSTPYDQQGFAAVSLTSVLSLFGCTIVYKDGAPRA